MQMLAWGILNSKIGQGGLAGRESIIQNTFYTMKMFPYSQWPSFLFWTFPPKINASNQQT